MMIKSTVADFIIHFFFAGSQPQATATYFPDYELVVVLAAHRSQILLIRREREALDQNLVQFEAVDHLQSVEVPDDDVGLHRDTEKE